MCCIVLGPIDSLSGHLSVAVFSSWAPPRNSTPPQSLGRHKIKLSKQIIFILIFIKFLWLCIVQALPKCFSFRIFLLACFVSPQLRQTNKQKTKIIKIKTETETTMKMSQVKMSESLGTIKFMTLGGQSRAEPKMQKESKNKIISQKIKRFV